MIRRLIPIRTFPVEPLTLGLSIAAVGLLFCSAVALAGSATPLSIAFIAWMSCALGWLAAELHRRQTDPSPGGLNSSRLDELPADCRAIVSSLVTSVSHDDPAFRRLVAIRWASFSEQVREWAQGRITFTGTEVWRTAYETVLTSPDITEYRSVAWMKSGDYWQDLPGKQGMQLNFELLDRGVRIERLLILGWNLWPPELNLPHASIRRWIDEQHYRGVWMLLVRECDLITEQDLLRDIGIYGDRAVGELHNDDCSRTVSFTLSFDPAAVRLAHEHWARLKLFARPYAELVDSAPGNGSAA